MPPRSTARSRFSDEEVARAVAKSSSIRQTLLQLGLHDDGANYKFVDRVVARLSLDTSHWRVKLEWPSDERVARAVADSSSVAQALRCLGLGGSSRHYTHLRRTVIRLSLDTSHWRPPRSMISDEQIVRAVADSISIAEVLRRLGLWLGGSNYAFVHRSVARLGLDTGHWLGEGHLKGKSHSWTPSIPLSEILVEYSTFSSTSRLKQRLIREGILQPCCYHCGISDWRGKPLALVLDHINGIYDDNRLENLRLLCPNCHSQTPTFAGRNQGRRRLALTAEARRVTIQAS